MRKPLTFTLNGTATATMAAEGAPLLTVLRDDLGVNSPKAGCLQGTCGACSVIVDGTLKLACLTLAETCEGARIDTVEGLHEGERLSPIQQAFMDNFAAQCGFCTPGMIMAAKALLDANPRPTREEVVEAISGNICRCTGYEPIIQAILSAAGAGAARTG